MDIDDFKDALRTRPATEVVGEIILGPGAKFVSQEAIDHATQRLRSEFRLAQQYQLEVVVVGSAKLGFSIAEKKVQGKPSLPRYREFDPVSSDIDLAIVSQKLFYDIWRDLSAYSYRQTPFPWESPLSKYLVLGWLRPDKFPTVGRPLGCQQWWELFNELSTSSIFKRKKVRGGLYFHRNFLNQYQQKAVLAAQQFERGESSL